jgi:hypothetical protein
MIGAERVESARRMGKNSRARATLSETTILVILQNLGLEAKKNRNIAESSFLANFHPTTSRNKITLSIEVGKCAKPHFPRNDGGTATIIKLNLYRLNLDGSSGSDRSDDPSTRSCLFDFRLLAST